MLIKLHARSVLPHRHFLSCWFLVTLLPIWHGVKNSWLWCECCKDEIIMSIVRVVMVVVAAACCELINWWVPDIPHITKF
jgi:hypothetical protein